MSALKATPGPWEAVAGNGDAEDGIYSASYPDRPIAKTTSYWQGDGPRRTERKANANLIASAPELYEAARLFVEEYDAGAQEDSVALMLAYNAALEAAKAALAKARGEAS